MKGVGHAPGDPQSVSLDGSYPKEKEYIRFLRYLAFYEVKGVGHGLGGPLSVSLDASDHKEQEYICFRVLACERFPRYKAFYEVKVVEHAPRGTPGSVTGCVS